MIEAIGLLHLREETTDVLGDNELPASQAAAAAAAQVHERIFCLSERQLWLPLRSLPENLLGTHSRLETR